MYVCSIQAIVDACRDPDLSDLSQAKHFWVSDHSMKLCHRGRDCVPRSAILSEVECSLTATLNEVRSICRSNSCSRGSRAAVCCQRARALTVDCG